MGRELPWVLIRAPIVTRAHHARLAELTTLGCRFLGITSYLGFPDPRYRDERDYGLLCEGWLHCFRDPAAHLPADGPRLLVSESDFTDPVRIDRALVARVPDDLVADVIHVSGGEAWGQDAKNWPLAARCLRRLVRDASPRVLVVDAPPGAEPIEGTRFLGAMDHGDLLAAIAAARCLLVPAVIDPSPRVLAEALCLDVPVVVNRRIIGGWKYVNHFTGTFFADEDDVVPAVRSVLRVRRRPRRWFLAHHGPARAGAEVFRLLRTLDPDLPHTFTYVLLKPDFAGSATDQLGQC
ncbi:hypothetical protein MXD62_28935 [Frankia sp. Mgl5]|nr:hypothetical protein [Frankia sp. Mgl5]